jgi:hypothetical protein
MRFMDHERWWKVDHGGLSPVMDSYCIVEGWKPVENPCDRWSIRKRDKLNSLEARKI